MEECSVAGLRRARSSAADRVVLLARSRAHCWSAEATFGRAGQDDRGGPTTVSMGAPPRVVTPLGQESMFAVA
jgi:hypothetical protein